MPGLRDSASGALDSPNQAVQQAHRAWQESMLRQIDELKANLRLQDPQILADHCGAIFSGDELGLHYWGVPIRIRWPDLRITSALDGSPVSTFDAAVLFYYLVTADGFPLEDRWVSYRELPGGTFYHQAFQGYSGDRLAKAFSERPDWLHTAAAALNGLRLTGIGEYAYAFQPLPRLRLAVLFWPGDEEFSSRASILFDPADIHYLPIDGLALMGSGLAGRLLKAGSSKAA